MEAHSNSPTTPRDTPTGIFTQGTMSILVPMKASTRASPYFSRWKRAAMSAARFLQPTRVHVRDGRIAEVGRAFGLGFPVKQGDVIKQLVVAAKEKLRQQDMGRFF